MSARPSAAELLKTPGALLTRTDLRELGRWRLAAWDALGRDGLRPGASKLPWLALDSSGIPISGRSQEIAP